MNPIQTLKASKAVLSKSPVVEKILIGVIFVMVYGLLTVILVGRERCDLALQLASQWLGQDFFFYVCKPMKMPCCKFLRQNSESYFLFHVRFTVRQ